MSFGSSYDAKEQVRQATDLVDLISRSIQLRRQGRMYVGLCPWHDDSRPSLQVNPEKQIWRCWVCDVGGDVFSFVMQREGVGFGEALRILAERAGIELQQAGPRKTEAGSPQDKPTLYRAVAWAEEQFHRCLKQDSRAEPARRYLAERGITDESIEKFHLGFSPPEWSWLLDQARSTTFSPAVLEAAGLLSKTQDGRRSYDRFRGRLLFSIRDTEKRPIAFGGRVLPEIEKDARAPKYVNSPETRLFSKSDQLYALDVVRENLSRHQQVVVVEGYTDVIMAHQHGLNQVVAVLGTALGQRHVARLKRFADRVTLVLDGDEAGQKRTNEILQLFVAAELDLRVLTLPGGLDPCDFLLAHGAEAFRELLDRAADALTHKIQTATRDIDVVNDPDRANRALDDILRTMASAPSPANASSESLRLRQQQMLVNLARQFHVEESGLRRRIAELRRLPRRTKPTPSGTSTNQPLLSDESELFEILIANPDLASDALQSIDVEQLSTSTARQLWNLFCELHQLGHALEFSALITAVEDSQLKSLLVRLEETGREKSELATENAAERLLGLVRVFRFRQLESDQRRSLAALDNRSYDEDEEINVLEKILEQQRIRQGLSAPTDG